MNLIKYLVIVYVLMLNIEQEHIPHRPSRQDRIEKRDKAIARNRRVYHDICGRGIWFDHRYHNYDHDRIKHPEWEGKFVSYNAGKVYDKSQQGRWETNYYKTRCYMDTGRIHNGDKKRKGKRQYKFEKLDEIRFAEQIAELD